MNIKKALFLVAALVVILALPYAAHAAGPNQNIWDPNILKGPLITCTGDGTGMAACSSLCDLVYTIINIVYWLIALVIWAIAPISFVIAGVMYMLAGSNPGMLETAKKTAMGAAIGIAVVLCGWLIINTLITVLGITGIGGFGNAACTIVGS